MNCYVCAEAGEDTVAVGTCRNCNIGLCLEHMREADQEPRRGGLYLGCIHDLEARVGLGRSASR